MPNPRDQHGPAPTDINAPAANEPPPNDDLVGDLIGPYRTLGRLGAGGMGVVYAAVRNDDHLKRRVAIKVIKRGRDTEEILKRFHVERQVLSALNHPNIARVTDAGTSKDGRSYFVMDYVDGMPIDKYCDFHRLSIAKRVQLFMKVCSAVQYAHQNLVVHRDIKPPNILVTPEGEPKLLDFGIAKLLNPDMQQVAVFTGLDMRLMTPEYASPEQVSGGSISTASDVYSLGVLLYELLTGVRPYAFKSRIEDEIRRVIMEVEPPRPSTAVTQPHPAGDETPAGATEAHAGTRSSTLSTGTLATRAQSRSTVVSSLRRELADDLDDIIMMAMRKTPRDRYVSAQQLADDLGHHLAGEPVMARPESVWYRLRKLTKRHRIAVTITAAFLVLTTASAITMGMLWSEANAARQRAQIAERLADFRAKAAVELTSRVNDDIIPEVQRLSGSLSAQKMLADAFEDYASTLRTQSRGDPALERELASSIEARASLEYNTRGARTGEPQKAMVLIDEALTIRRSLASPADALPVDRENLLRALIIKADLLSSGLMKVNDAISLYAEAIRVAEATITASTDDQSQPHMPSRLLAVSLVSLGDQLRNQGRLEEAAQAYQRSLDLRRTIAQQWPADRDVQRDLSVGYIRIGRLADQRQQWPEAIKAFNDAMDIRLRRLQQEPLAGQTRRDVMNVHESLASTHLNAGQFVDARKHADLGLALARTLAFEAPDNARAAWDLFRLRGLDGRILAAQGDHAAAQIALTAARNEAIKAADVTFPMENTLRLITAQIGADLGDELKALNRPSEAIPVWEDALKRARALAAADATDVDLRDLVARLESRLQPNAPK